MGGFQARHSWPLRKHGSGRWKKRKNEEVDDFILALAVSAMAVNMILAGVHVGVGEFIMFPSIAMISSILTVVLLRNVTEPPGASIS